jgi:hypothetical protein
MRRAVNRESPRRLIELATQNAAGFDRRMFADALRGVQRYSDKQFAAYGLDAQAAAALRRQFNDRQRHLTQAEPDQHPSWCSAALILRRSVPPSALDGLTASGHDVCQFSTTTFSPDYGTSAGRPQSARPSTGLSRGVFWTPPTRLAHQTVSSRTKNIGSRR